VIIKDALKIDEHYENAVVYYRLGPFACGFGPGFNPVAEVDAIMVADDYLAI
jgi:hypothetical protein